MSETAGIVIPTFGMPDRLRKAREVTGLTQAELADELGIARSSVANYEAGTTSPRRIVLKAYALRTRVPVEWLEHGVDPSGPDGGLPRLDSNQQPSD